MGASFGDIMSGVSQGLSGIGSIIGAIKGTPAAQPINAGNVLGQQTSYANVLAPTQTGTLGNILGGVSNVLTNGIPVQTSVDKNSIFLIGGMLILAIVVFKKMK